MTDPSNNLFGPASGELAKRVGAVAMHAALLESDIEALASSIGDLRQDEVAGVGADRASRAIEWVLAESYTADDEHEFVANVLSLLAEVRLAFERRNLVVHGVWNVKEPGRYFVWKPKRREKTTADWVDGEMFTGADLDDVISELRRLHALVRAASSCAASRPRRSTPSARKRLNPKTHVSRGASATGGDEPSGCR